MGKHIANTQFYILDKNNNICPPGVPGGIIYGGKGLSTGYINNKNLTDEKFVSNPFDNEKKSKIYKTGDLVKLNSQKKLEFLGRIDDQVKIRGYRIELGEIESVLRKNEFVKDAAVISRDFGNGSDSLIAFYSPNGYSNNENVLVQNNSIDWENNWEELYRNAISKNDTHKADNKEIGYLVVDQFEHDDRLREHYLEWVNSTTERIQELNPKRILEIGCGGGDILKRIIHNCEFYAASDISKTIIDHLNSELEKLNINKFSYKLFNLKADEELPFPKRSFDTIIINSVVQYFPDQFYLARVLDKLLGYLDDGGCLFIGDVQSFTLLPNFNFYDQLRFVAKDIKAGEFKKLNAARLNQVPELFIDPEYFHTYLKSKTDSYNLEIKLMRGSLENEPIIYHYDVFIYLNREKNKSTSRKIVWDPDKHSVEYLKELLKSENNLIYIEDIPNKRIGERIFKYQKLENSNDNESAFDILNSVIYNGPDIDPESLWELENESFKVELFLPLWGDQLHFTAAFVPKALKDTLISPEYKSGDEFEAKQCCNNPALNFAKEKINRELKKYLQLSLPEYMIPLHIIELRDLPLTPSNKIDKKALQNIEISETNLNKKNVLPETVTEEIFFDIWKKLLGYEALSIDDNFFELGGHSILAAQMFTDYERISGRRIPLSTLFSAQTIRQLSCIVDETKKDKKWSSVVEIRKGSHDLPPLFLVHGAEGNVLLYRDLANRLDSSRSIYGLQSRGLNGTDKINERIEEMAEDYLSQIKLVQPTGPYNLGGYCMGGTIAYEMSRQLINAGEVVNILFLLETYNACTITNGNNFINRTKEKFENLKFHYDNIKILKGNDRTDFIKIKTETLLIRSTARIKKIQTKLGLNHNNGQKARYLSLSLRKINDFAQLKYQPLPLECNVVLLKPKISFSSEPDPKFGWADFIKGGIRVFDLDVAPRGMLVEPFVKITARIIDQELSHK